MPTTGLPTTPSDPTRKKVLFGCAIATVVVLAIAPYAFLSLEKALWLSAAICASISAAALVFLISKPGQEPASGSSDRPQTLLTSFAIYLALTLFLTAVSVGVFFRFTFWKALLLSVVLSLIGAILLTAGGFILLALNRGLLEKRPIDPDAPR